jgi:hypothetical protein
MAFIRITGLLLFEFLTISALHRLGSLRGFGVKWTDLLSSSTRADDAIASGLRLVTLIIAYWLALSTMAYIAARISALPSAISAARWTTMPVIRKAVDQALALSLTVGTLVAPAPALAHTSTTPPPVEEEYVPVAAGFSGATEPLVGVDDQIIIPPGAMVPPPKPALPDVSTTDPTTIPTHLLFERMGKSHVVRDGDSLWSIAAAHLETSGISNPTESIVAAYWMEILSANLGSIRSGDPDLIFPGETVALPPIAP